MLLSDNELLGRYVIANDQDAIESLIRLHSNMVMNVCRSLLWQEEDAEDAFQATFLLLSIKARKLLHHNSVGGWLHEAAVRICLNLRRQICRIRELELAEESVSKTKEPWREIAASHDLELLHRELSRLPKHIREAIVLVHLEGRSRSHAASILDCTTAAIKGSLARGRKQLRQRLIRHGIVASTLLGSASLTSSAESDVTDSLVNSTMQHCQGRSQNLGIGTGPEIVLLLVEKELTMSTFGILKAVVTSVFFVAFGTLAIVAVASDAALTTWTETTLVELAEDDTPTYPKPIRFIQELAPNASDSLQQSTQAAGIGGGAETTVEGVSDGRPFPKNANEVAKARIEIHQLVFETTKTVDETWDAYIKRLLKLGHLSKEQFDRWHSGDAITIKRKLEIIDTRHEQRIRQVPLMRNSDGAKVRSETRTRTVSNPDGTSFEQEYTVMIPVPGEKDDNAPNPEMVTQTYTVAIPFTRSVEAELTIPAPGSMTPTESNQGITIPVSRKKMLAIKRDESLKIAPDFSNQRTTPQQTDVKYDELLDITSAVYIMRNSLDATGHPGYEFVGRIDGKLYSQMLDINQDGQLDQWVFFKGGRETYREVDLDFDKKVDQYQYTEGKNVRYGIDEDQDGRIDRWIDR